MSLASDIAGGIAAVLFWGCVMSACTKSDPEISSGRFLPADSTSEHCSYMFEDGSIAHYTRHGECPARMFDELEAK
jgi:hypothetical protein